MEILVADDDLATRKMIRFVLERVGGHQVAEAEGFDAAERMVGEGHYDLVTLDVKLRDGDGLRLCREIRRVSNVPIVMLSALGNIPDRVHGLKTGADDYISKPFDPSELLARVDALGRRARQAVVPEGAERLRVGDLAFDLIAQSVTVRGEAAVGLTRTELRLLLELARAHGEARTRAQLAVALWGTEAGASPNTIDSYVSDLRRKLEQDHARPRYLLTVRGKGYRLLSGPDPASNHPHGRVYVDPRREPAL